MHVAIVTPKVTADDGQGRVNLEIVRTLIERGHRATLIASVVDPDVARLPAVRWIQPYGGSLPTQLLSSQVVSRSAQALLRRVRPEVDVVTIDGAVTIADSDVNAVHFVHGAWLRSPFHTRRLRRDAYGAYHGVLTRVHHAQERAAFSRARAVVAVSGRVADELAAIGVPREKIEVIFNGVDVERFRPGAVDRAAIGLPDVPFLALFAGDIKTPRKNLDTVLRAIARSADVHLAVAGSVERSPYPAMARDLGIASRVSFLGFRSDMPALMRAADVFVFPSRYEPCGLVVLESLASGTPVITARSVGGAEVLTGAEGVAIDDPDDDAAIAHALDRYRADDAVRRRAGEHARRLALEHTWSAMAERYVALYERMRRAA